jgi:hypothetical protein
VLLSSSAPPGGAKHGMAGRSTPIIPRSLIFPVGATSNTGPDLFAPSHALPHRATSDRSQKRNPCLASPGRAADYGIIRSFTAPRGADERGLRDLHEEVARARRQMPQVQAIAERLRAEANIARVDISAEQSKLRRELAATKRTVSVLRARHSNLNFSLSQFMRSMQNIQSNEIAYESASERMIIRQQIHPDASKALREFAAMVIDNDDVVH